MLQVVDGNHASSFLDEHSVLVHSAGTRHLLVHLTDLQDVLQTVKGDLRYDRCQFIVRSRQEAALTWMILLSIDLSRSHNGLITP